MTPSLVQLKLIAHDYLLPFGLKILIAGVVFVLGRMIARLIVRGMHNVMDRRSVDLSVRTFLGNTLYAVMLVAVATVSLDTLGVKTTAVIAFLGAAGLTAGLALQGSLSNFAAGVMLIVLRPYKTGDLVVIGKYLGRVDSIRVFHTIVITGDNREIAIPNGQIVAAPIENLTILGSRRVDIVISVAHGSDLREVKTLLDGIVRADQRVQATPPPGVDLAEVTEASMRLYVRPWTSVENYTRVATETIERIKDALDAKGLPCSVALQTPS
jgi:small conductance mechanosensitive channel